MARAKKVMMIEIEVYGTDGFERVSVPAERVEGVWALLKRDLGGAVGWRWEVTHIPGRRSVRVGKKGESLRVFKMLTTTPRFREWAKDIRDADDLHRVYQSDPDTFRAIQDAIREASEPPKKKSVPR